MAALTQVNRCGGGRSISMARIVNGTDKVAATICLDQARIRAANTA